MTRPRATAEPLFVLVDETAYVYVRPMGEPSFGAGRRLVVELQPGDCWTELGTASTAYDIVSPKGGPAELGEAQAAGTSDETAARIDAWIRTIAKLPPFSADSRAASQLAAGDVRQVNGAAALASHEPVWIEAEGELLSLASSSSTAVAGGQGASRVRRLPCVDGLHVLVDKATAIRAIRSSDLLERAHGAEALREARDHVAQSVAGWQTSLQEAQASSAQAATEHKQDQLEFAREAVTRVADDEARRAPRSIRRDPLLAAVEAVLEQDDVVVREPVADVPSERPEERLAQVAVASNVRFRDVTLESGWWRREGPPLLVFRASDDYPLAASWKGDRFHLLDARDGRSTPLDGEQAACLRTQAYALYPSLPNRITVGGLRDFALRGSAREIRAMLALSALAMLISLLVPIGTGVIVSTAIPDGRIGLLSEMALLIVSAAFGAAGFTYARSLASVRASAVIDMRLQAALWDRLLRLPPAFFRKYSTGDLAGRAQAVDEMRRILTGPVLAGLMSGLFAGLSFFVMLVYDVRLALFGLAFAVLTAGVLFAFARRQVGHLFVYRQADGKVSSRVLDLLSGIAKLRSAAAEERAFARWAEDFSFLQRANWKAGRIRAAQAVLNTVLPSLALLGTFAVAGLRSEPIELAAFAAFNAALGQFVAAAGGLSYALASALEAIPLARRLRPILDARPEVDEGRADPGPLRGRITVRNVSFRYASDGPLILDEVDFEVQPGEFVAIVGASGSGKSTLMRLLLGFENPDSGAVFYERRDLARLDLRLLRRQIGAVLQDSGLTPGSLYENIAGASMPPDEQVMAAARQAGLEEDIRSFPMGLETFVSEDAGTLSGGQRQRVVIARALIRKPPILFFDEATSALDNRTQATVSENLERLDVTRVVVAHRLSTIRNADRILVLEGGRLVETGKYDDLMRRRGVFYRLASRQLV